MICEFSDFVAEQGYSVLTCESGIVYGIAIQVFIITAIMFLIILRK